MERAAPAIGYFGLGSNIGDRRAHLREAVAELPRFGVDVLASSSVYETEPVGLVLDQREFFNTCLRVRTRHGPEELLEACKAIERSLGRTFGGERHGVFQEGAAGLVHGRQLFSAKWRRCGTSVKGVMRALTVSTPCRR